MFLIGLAEFACICDILNGLLWDGAIECYGETAGLGRLAGQPAAGILSAAFLQMDPAWVSPDIIIDNIISHIGCFATASA